MIKRILTIIILVLLIFGLIIVVYLVRQQTKLPGRATTPGVLSLENSYLFASPLVARVGGGEKITISAFVLSDQGLGIPGEKVVLYSAPALQALTIRDETDSRGLAVFEITSQTSGSFTLWATVAGKGQIKQQVTVTFTP
ncbi:MAG: Ig-like domain-containing protein [Patescibacteria group bacterium]